MISTAISNFILLLKSLMTNEEQCSPVEDPVGGGEGWGGHPSMESNNGVIVLGLADFPLQRQFVYL